MHYDFPGNVRELENIIQHAAALTEGERLTPEDLPARLRTLRFAHGTTEELLPMAEVEKRHIARVLAATEYNLKAASHILGIPRTTLWPQIKKHGLAKG